MLQGELQIRFHLSATVHGLFYRSTTESSREEATPETYVVISLVSMIKYPHFTISDENGIPIPLLGERLYVNPLNSTLISLADWFDSSAKIPDHSNHMMTDVAGKSFGLLSDTRSWWDEPLMSFVFR